MKKTVECNPCGWTGDVSELILYEQNGEDTFHCPICDEEV